MRAENESNAKNDLHDALESLENQNVLTTQLETKLDSMQKESAYRTAQLRSLS